MSYSSSQEVGTAERKINYSDKKAQATLDFIAHLPEATWDQVEESVDAGVYNGMVRAELHADIEDFRKWHWKPADVERNARIRKFRRDLRRSILQSLQEIDHLSAVGAHRVAVIGQREGGRWRPWFGQRLVANFGRAAFGTIQGPPQTGKTNTGLYMGEQFAAKDPQKNVVISNISVRNPPSWYRHADMLTGLFRAIVGRGPQDRPEGGFNPKWDPGLADRKMRWLWIFDEAGVAWKKKKASSNVSMILETVAKHLGKNDGNILFIEQTREGVPTIIEGFARNRYRAIAPGVIRIDQGDREDWRTENWHDTVRNFPKTSLSYDPDDRAPFLIDLDVDALNASLAGASNQVAGIRRYLDRIEVKGEPEDGRSALRKEFDVERVRAAREANMTWPQIEMLIGISSRTLRKGLKEADEADAERKIQEQEEAHTPP